VDHLASLRELVNDMDRGAVEVLIILGGNPVYTAPADLRFRERMQRVRFRMHLSLYQDETSRQCHWHVPEAHYLEAWSDTRAFGGTASIVQPLIEPLYQGRSAHDLLSALTGPVRTPGYEIVRAHWREHWQDRPADFERLWQTAVHDGVVAGTKLAPRSVPDPATRARIPAAAPTATTAHGTYEIVFEHDPTVYDGRFANYG
jgi:molybdopterin-containing oxidoreductase family iron-sulfur binding subunit